MALKIFRILQINWNTSQQSWKYRMEINSGMIFCTYSVITVATRAWLPDYNLWVFTLSWWVLKNLRALEPLDRFALPPPGKSWTFTWNYINKHSCWRQQKSFIPVSTWQMNLHFAVDIFETFQIKRTKQPLKIPNTFPSLVSKFTARLYVNLSFSSTVLD